MSYPEAHYLGDKGEISAIYLPADQEPDLTIGSSSVPRQLLHLISSSEGVLAKPIIILRQGSGG